MRLPQDIILNAAIEIPHDLPEQTIRVLNEIGKNLRNVCVQLPSEEEFDKAKLVIENILSPHISVSVRAYYVIHVLIAYEYARTHFREGGCSMLDDIIAGKTVSDEDIPSYNLCKVEVFCEREITPCFFEY